MLLANASGRLDEVSALQARNSAEGIAAMPDTLDDFSDQADDAADVLLDEYARTGDRDAVTELRTFTARAAWTRWSSSAPTCPPRPAPPSSTPPRCSSRSTTGPRPPAPTCGGGIDEVPPMFLRSFSDGLVSPATHEHRSAGRHHPDRDPRPRSRARTTAAARRLDPVRRRRAPRRCRTDGGRRDGTDGGDPVRDLTKKVLGGPAGVGPEGPGQGPRGRGRRPAARRRRRRHRPARPLIRPPATPARASAVSGRRTPASSAAGRASAGSSRAPGR